MTVDERLTQAMALARTGQKASAAALLKQVLAEDAHNVPAWLWLSGVVEAGASQVRCLEQAMHYAPADAQIQTALQRAKSRQAQVLTDRAIAARDAGERATAQALLTQAVDCDEAYMPAWWWLGQLSESPEDQEICFENVLVLAPDHVAAREALEGMRQGQALTEAMADFAISKSKIPNEAVQPDYRVASSTAPVTALRSSAGLFEDAWACVRCAAHAEHSERHCPVCGQALWLRERVVERARPTYRFALTLDFILMLGSLLLPLLLLAYISVQLDVEDVGILWRVYMGQVTPEAAGVPLTFTVVSQALFWLSLPPVICSLLMALCVLSRWQPLFFVALSLCGMQLSAGLTSSSLAVLGHLGAVGDDPLALLAGTANRYMRVGILLADVTLVGLSALFLTLLLNVQDHFRVVERRLFLQLDQNMERIAVSFWMHGRAYVKQGWWAIGALHLRHSLALEERVEAYLQLALAYSHLDYQELAQNTLRDAERFSPGHPQVARLREFLI